VNVKQDIDFSDFTQLQNQIVQLPSKDIFPILDAYPDLSIIKYPIITDKATRLLVNNQYTFAVSPTANKLTIKSLIECIFNVKVIKITTSHLPKKKKRVGKYLGWKSHYKKAIVTLLEGDTIDLFLEKNDQTTIN